MTAQEGAKFVVGEKYIRMKDTGWVYPIHEEQEKLVKKDLAEYVIAEADGKFRVVKADTPAERPVSTPQRRPVPAASVPAAQVAPEPVLPPVVKVTPPASSGLDLSSELPE